MDFLTALLLTTLPQCVEEDDPWCVYQGDAVTVINLALDDPAPTSIIIHR